jgi:tRNA wybutosine-synthesizing protein 1
LAISISPPALSRWKASYALAGRHSALQICTWSKKSMRGKGECYKNVFYGVDTHRCAQMSPAFAWCHENCVFCWRPNEFMEGASMQSKEADAPQLIISECVAQRKRLVSGIKGADDALVSKCAESFTEFPSHWAISLSGEPTIYPLLPELVLELRAHPEVRSIFIVTNGQEPEMIAKLSQMKALPTQLYVSVDAWDEKSFEKINRPKEKDAWARLLKTLGMLKRLDCRTVARFTLIKGVNDGDEQAREMARIFADAKPDFIEIKSYMHLGDSRKRLERENMPTHAEVLEFAAKTLAGLPEYRMEGEHALSRIALLKNKNSPYPNYIKAADAGKRQ